MEDYKIHYIKDTLVVNVDVVVEGGIRNMKDIKVFLDIEIKENYSAYKENIQVKENKEEVVINFLDENLKKMDFYKGI